MRPLPIFQDSPSSLPVVPLLFQDNPRNVRLLLQGNVPRIDSELFFCWSFFRGRLQLAECILAPLLPAPSPFRLLSLTSIVYGFAILFIDIDSFPWSR